MEVLSTSLLNATAVRSS